MTNDEYMKLLDAIKLAWEVHKGQYRKDGYTPYIVHPLTVMLNVESYKAKIVAILHDTIEDNPSYPNLRQQIIKFGIDVAEAVNALTKPSYNTYEEYINNVKNNELARVVKIADILHNLSDLKDTTQIKRIEKYKKALDILKWE